MGDRDFPKEFVRHIRCARWAPSACGLRQGAVNAGGSQVDYQEGAPSGAQSGLPAVARQREGGFRFYTLSL